MNPRNTERYDESFLVPMKHLLPRTVQVYFHTKFSAFVAFALRGSFLLCLAGIAAAQCLYFDGFIDNLDGTISDPRTNLSWKRCAEGQEWKNGRCEGVSIEMTWYSALSAASRVSKADVRWRLPTTADFTSVMGEQASCIRTRPIRQASPTLSSPTRPNGQLGGFWTINQSKGGATLVDMHTGSISEGKGLDSMGEVRLISGGSLQAQSEHDRVYDEVVLRPIREREAALFRAKQMEEQRIRDAESERATQRARDARRQAYERRLQTVKSSKDPQSMYLSAGQYRRDDDRSGAEAIYMAIIERFPNSEWAVRANDQLLADRRVDLVNQSNEAAVDSAGRRAFEACKIVMNACYSQGGKNCYRNCEAVR